ncbi:MAG: hypothetical protein LBH96_02270 [Candidatus Peribacteria bacterium]|nr:hypothetical protein [Candidatus Peribacteria bacterium]
MPGDVIFNGYHQPGVFHFVWNMILSMIFVLGLVLTVCEIIFEGISSSKNIQSHIRYSGEVLVMIALLVGILWIKSSVCILGDYRDGYGHYHMMLNCFIIIYGGIAIIAITIKHYRKRNKKR